MPAAIAALFERRREPALPSTSDLAAVEPRHAEQRQRQLGAAGAEQADEAEDLAGVDGRARRPRIRRRGSRRRTSSTRLLPDVAARGQRVLDAFAGHQLGQPMVVDLGCAERCRPCGRRAARSPARRSRSTSSSRWLTKTMATPCAFSRRTVASSSSTSCRVSEAVGSSMNRMRALAASPRQIATIWRCATGSAADAAHRAAGRRRAGRAPPAPPSRIARRGGGRSGAPTAPGRSRCSPRPSGWGTATGPGR